MTMRVVYFNGEYVPESEARVSIFDSSLMFGDMAFEATRTFGHKPFKLRQHLERLYGSMRLLEIDCGLSIDEMEQVTMKTLGRNLLTEPTDVDWQIMHDISAGPLAGYRSLFPDRARPTISINCWPLITQQGYFAPFYDSGVNLGIVAQQAIPAHLLDAKAKTRSRLHYQMATNQGQRMGNGVWAVMLDPDGYLAEGPGWNLFLVKDGVLYTPEPRNILLGVSRAATMELAQDLDIPVRERNLGRYEALRADELFCTATTCCLVHAVSFEGQQIGNGEPGPIFRTLMDAWNRIAGFDIRAQARAYAERVVTWEEKQRGAS